MKRLFLPLPLLLLVMVAAAWLQPLDDLAAARAESGLKRAVASYATARALNAVISVVQGTEVSAGLGLGMTLTPGQALDPLNDLVEQFSTLMLAASIAFGAQILLLEIGGAWVMSLALSLAAGAWAWFRWQGKPPPGLLSRVLVALLLVRFIVPVAGLASDLAYRAFMADEYVASQQGIEQSTSLLREADPAASGWKLADIVDNVRQAAERTIDYAIRLSVVFLLQTTVLPMAVVWILLQAGRALLHERAARPPG